MADVSEFFEAMILREAVASTVDDLVKAKRQLNSDEAALADGVVGILLRHPLALRDCCLDDRNFRASLRMFFAFRSVRRSLDLDEIERRAELALVAARDRVVSRGDLLELAVSAVGADASPQ